MAALLGGEYALVVAERSALLENSTNHALQTCVTSALAAGSYPGDSPAGAIS